MELAVRAELDAWGASGTARAAVAVNLATALDRAKVGHAGLARELLHLLGAIRMTPRR